MPERLRNAPSAASLIKYFRVSLSEANEIREVVSTSKSPRVALLIIDKRQLLVGYGVEDYIIDPHYYGRNQSGNIAFSYINTGDTYSPTLIARGDRVFIGCWGDEYERLPKNQREES